MTEKRLLHPGQDFEILHITLKATGRGHKGNPWIFNHDKRTELLEQFKRFLGLYGGVTVLSFCAMSNHLHILVKIDHTFSRNRREMSDAYFECYKKKIHPNSSKCYKLQQEQDDISKLMQRFARDFAINFNINCDFKRTGHLWSERFHSTQIEDSASLLRCWVYIIFNPVKAAMVDNPLEDSFNSLTFYDKEWCENAMHEMYEVYKLFTQGSHGQSYEEFKEMLLVLLEDEVKRWHRLKENQQEKWKEEHHFWDKASAVAANQRMEKLQIDLKWTGPSHLSEDSGLSWI